MALNPRMIDWRGRRVWLVGASTGIGRALAASLHAQGAQVIVSARQAQALNAFVREHPGAQALALDATDALAVSEAASTVFAQGALDCVVYCAGHYRAMSALKIDLPDMLRHNQVNYVGALNLLDAVLPHLLAQPPARRGHISLVGSVAGYRGLPKAWPMAPPKLPSSTWPKPCTWTCAPKAWACPSSAPALWKRRSPRKTSSKCPPSSARSRRRRPFWKAGPAASLKFTSPNASPSGSKPCSCCPTGPSLPPPAAWLEPNALS